MLTDFTRFDHFLTEVSIMFRAETMGKSALNGQNGDER